MTDEGRIAMQPFIRTLIAVASLALLFGCAATGESTEEQTGVQPDFTGQPEWAGQPGQEVYSYPYGQAPSGYDAYDFYDTTMAGTSPGIAAVQPGAQPGRGVAGAVSADRVVYFDFDSAQIRADSRPIIDANARALMGNPQIITQLEGHTDERGSREYNIALGERRANSVRQYMIAMGVSPQQIRVVSYGEERPVAFGRDEQSFARNRRVEIVY
jgi:peptidoglycan-associated lipoprotein